MNNSFKITILLGYLGLMIFNSSCNNEDYQPLRLSKSNLKLVNNAIFEIVVPKNEDTRVVYERPIPWHQLSFRERNDKYFSIGTAFFTSEKTLLSAAHVFSLEDFSTRSKYFVRNTKGEVFEVNKIQRYSQYRDFIEFDLKSYPKNIQKLKLNANVEIGDTVFAVGNAQGEGISVRGGQVASFTPEFVNGKWNFIRFSSPASPGNSGGPLVNSKAEVVGIIVMKNQAENYNYAYPVSEFKKITYNKAIFFDHNVTVIDGTETEVEDWSFSVDLPNDPKTLSKEAHTSLNKFYKKLLINIKEKNEVKLFPKHEMFREYLRRQTHGKYFGSVETETSKQEWDVTYNGMSKIKIGPNRFMYKNKQKRGDFQLLIEKPKDTSLKNFIDNPKLYMDNILIGLGFTRSVGKEKIRILSYGESDKKHSWVDQLGRKWFSSYWFITHNDGFYSLDCLPVPVGVACLFQINDSSFYSSGFEHFQYFNASEKPLSYFGDIDEWKEFLALGDKYIPNNFFVKKVDYTNGVEISLEETNISLKSTEFNKKSHLLLHVGYDLNSELKLSVESLKILKEKNKREGIYLTRMYKPSELSSVNHVQKWKKIKNRKSPYNSKYYENKDTYYSKSILFDKENSAFVFTCFSDQEKHKKGLSKECKSYSKNIKMSNL